MTDDRTTLVAIFRHQETGKYVFVNNSTIELITQNTSIILACLSIEPQPDPINGRLVQGVEKDTSSDIAKVYDTSNIKDVVYAKHDDGYYYLDDDDFKSIPFYLGKQITKEECENLSAYPNHILQPLLPKDEKTAEKLEEICADNNCFLIGKN